LQYTFESIATHQWTTQHLTLNSSPSLREAFHLSSHHIARLLLSIFIIGSGSTVPATHEAFACGGADNTLTIYGTPPASSPLSHGNNNAVNEGEAGHAGPRMLRSYGLSAPVLCLDSYGPYVACSLMDGGHAVVSIHSFIHSFVHAFIHLFIDSFIHFYSHSHSHSHYIVWPTVLCTTL
jgi:hypothetical protein